MNLCENLAGGTESATSSGEPSRAVVYSGAFGAK